MTKRRASPGYRDAFNYYNSAVHPHPSPSLLHPSGTATLGSCSLQSSDGNSLELQSEISIEEDVIELNSKVQQLVEQVGVLADGQNNAEDNFTRFKQESATFTARIVMLEEHIKEIETRGEEHLQEEQRKNKILLDSKEREKQLEIENYAIRYQSLEKDHLAVLEEINVLRLQEETIQQEKKKVEEQLFETQLQLLREQEQHRILQENMARKVEDWREEREASCQLVQEMAREVNDLREQQQDPANSNQQMEQPERSEVFADLTARIVEMQTEMKQLREENRCYRESNEELEVAILSKGLEQGRQLLNTQNSLAAELETMDETEMRKTLGEQKDVNLHLQTYIDSVLLNIMERYPELLEITKK